MEQTTLEFSHNARTTYTAIKHLFETHRTEFSGMKFDDDLFVVEARRGAWLSPFSEKIKMKVVAVSERTCRVVVKSSSRSIFNLLNFGANKGNVNELCDYINNAVHKLHHITDVLPDGRVKDHSEIRIVRPDIRFRT